MIKLYGADWCADCFRIKWFLENHKIHHEYIDIEDDELAADFVVKVNPDGNKSIPVIVFDDGEILIEPRWRDIAMKLGMRN